MISESAATIYTFFGLRTKGENHFGLLLFSWHIDRTADQGLDGLCFAPFREESDAENSSKQSAATAFQNRYSHRSRMFAAAQSRAAPLAIRRHERCPTFRQFDSQSLATLPPVWRAQSHNAVSSRPKFCAVTESRFGLLLFQDISTPIAAGKICALLLLARHRPDQRPFVRAGAGALLHRESVFSPDMIQRSPPATRGPLRLAARGSSCGTLFAWPWPSAFCCRRARFFSPLRDALPASAS